MRRLFCIVGFVLALTLPTGGSVAAHKISVTTPAGEVLFEEPIAKELTPRIFDDEGNYVGEDETNNSAASQGTNTACEAVPAGGPVLITGGECHK